MPEARLVYLVGPSGSGKDTLLSRLRAREPTPFPVLVAHRYITRPAGAGGENHVALSEHEFRQRLRLGCFALSWSSHGLHYGVGREIDLWLDSGVTVVVNGSRSGLPDAAERYGKRFHPVLLALPVAVQRARLLRRGRENASQIAARLARDAELPPLRHPALEVLDADAPPESLVDRLLQRLAPELAS